MTKNYFTDKQVEELVNKIGDTPLYNCEFVTLTPQELKALMNLAVEAAIGEKVGFLIKHFDGEYELDFNETWQKVKEQLPLYSVKELEN